MKLTHSAALPTVMAGLGAGGRRLSEGAVIQVSARARLMGVRLLRLEATIVASPAATEKRQRPDATSRAWPRPAPLAVPEGVIGSKLGEAICVLDEGAVRLAGTQEVSSVQPKRVPRPAPSDTPSRRPSTVNRHRQQQTTQGNADA